MTSRRSVSAGALLAVIAAVALNLRPFIAGIGPLAADIGAHTGLDLMGLSLLTLVPMLLMGVVAFMGPALQARVGGRSAVLASLVLLAVGSALRLFVSAGWQMIATAAMLGLGAAVVQAVFPGIIKWQFPGHVSVVMGVYSSMLMAGGALGAQLSPLVAAASGNWHLGLAWMALPALAGLALASHGLPRDEAQRSQGGAGTGYLARPRVWLLMVCFGLVNGGYSSVVAWLAPFYQEHGWRATTSGGLLALLTVCQALAALVLPMLARKHEDRRPWLWLTLVMQAAGFAGLAFFPDGVPVLWVALLGAGLGGCFALSLIVALDHLPDPVRAGMLSAFVQGGGFLIAAIAPWVVAALHEASGAFQAGWLLHLACVGLVAALYRVVAPASYATSMRAAAAHGGPA